jgi:prepilin-type processing-associated H-X9-DG protein
VSRTDNLRSYSLSSFFSDGEGSSDWGGPPTWRISTRSRIPKPSETICVVTEFDHRGYNINGWGISPFGPTWIDKLMIWDTGYFNFAFADGHVERYKWAGESYTDSDPIDVAFMRPQTDVYYPGPDWDWISKRLFPGTRALYGGW